MDIFNTICIAIIFRLVSAIKLPVEQVYHGDHFDELVVSSRNLFSTNIILVIYGHNCRKDLIKQRVSLKGLPPSNFLLVLKYHSDKAKEINWLDMDEEQDLKRRYNSSTCLDVMFFKRHSPRKSNPIRWKPGNDPPFSEWAWQMVSVRVVFVNEIHMPLHVHFESLSLGSPIINSIEVDSKTKKIVYIYPAYIALLIAKQNPESGMDAPGSVFVDAKIIKNEEKFVVSVPTKRSDKPSDYVLKIKGLQKAELDRYSKWLAENQRRTLVNIFQPTLLPSFRADGYRVVKAGKDFHMHFVKYYMHKSRSREEVVCNKVDAALNPKQYTNNCSIINIEPVFKADVLPQMQSYAESFCNCKLKCTSLNTFTLYHRNNFVYRSLEEPQKAVITVILQIMKDTNSLEKNPWLMELILPGGAKMVFDLNMAEVLIYESARLIFGRPKPLKAPVHIEIAAHFVPVDEWDYTAKSILEEIDKKMESKSDGTIDGRKRKDEL